MYAVFLAGGIGARFEPGKDKLWQTISGVPVWLHGANALDARPEVRGVVLVCPPEKLEQYRSAASGLRKLSAVVAGGRRRQDSCAAGLAALPDDADVAAVHDAARPNVSPALLDRVFAPFAEEAVVPALPLRETVKRVGEGLVTCTLDRSSLYCTQTPQVAWVAVLRAALAKADGELTDEAAMVESVGGRVRVVEGDPANIKLTVPEDLARLRELMQPGWPKVRTGIGYDVHRLEAGIPLVLGGVRIEYSSGLVGHSDGDALTHAVCDALLGAAGLPDIGVLFPNTDPSLKGIDSQRLLRDVAQRLAAGGWQTEYIDCTVIAEAPKLAPHIPAMRARLAESLGLVKDAVNVKATTNEGLGSLGAGLGIAAYAVATIYH